ncbi:hypothetical protein GCU56_13755 [Geodermatophilus sabuli]|uniref:Uncharacterized protein n=1 Tax=Geodermatophilus sabuli TaxID=1564158 RepID=A0A7K3W218_9ACTN|nr:hypothetical protein [Geodermatophilus sabuli]NEK58931.1 hypothetical protein [Geodermatophilus sabuli]
MDRLGVAEPLVAVPAAERSGAAGRAGAVRRVGAVVAGGAGRNPRACSMAG